MTALISPSILNCDFSHLADELDKIASADFAHIDIMDNHFVPNLALGLPIAEAAVNTSSVPCDAHLMIEAPDRWAPAYAELGFASVTFHAEAAMAPVKLARELHAMGVRLSLDDFVAGYASLSYLRELPFAEMKIDRAFTRGIVRDAHAATITRNLLQLGRDLGIDVIAEGIEEAGQYELLRETGCDGVMLGRGAL